MITLNKHHKILDTNPAIPAAGSPLLPPRYYEPKIGRFNRLDCFDGLNSEPLTLHKYGYAHADPVNGIDPTGMFTYIEQISVAYIQSTLAGMEGEAGANVMAAGQDVAAGASFDQALKTALFGSILGLGFLAAVPIAKMTSVAFRPMTTNFARIGDAIILPGTILTRTRMIPGVVGKVTGGSSTALKNAILVANGIKTSVKAIGYQAHHLIPVQLRDHRVLKKIGMYLDDATNGILLSITLHRGYHGRYNRAMRRALNTIPSGLSAADTMNEVYFIQSRATSKLADSNIISRINNVTEDQWFTWLIKG